MVKETLMLEGFKKFLEYVRDLKNITMDYEECWSQYTAPDFLYRKDEHGVFIPYDPNSNLLKGSTKMFYDTFSTSAKRCIESIDNNISKDTLTMSGIKILFLPCPRMKDVPGITQTCSNFLLGELYHQPSNKYPRLVYNRTGETIELVKKAIYKQLLKIIASYLAISSFTKDNATGKHSVQELINWSYYGSSREWISSRELHSSRRFTFLIPIKPPPSYHHWRIVRFSFD